jgi:hypothetical protein
VRHNAGIGQLVNDVLLAFVPHSWNHRRMTFSLLFMAVGDCGWKVAIAPTDMVPCS